MSVVQMIVDAAVREVPGAGHAGVTVLNRHSARTPVSAGVAIAPMACAFLVASLTSTRLVARFGRGVVVGGAALQVAGIAEMALMTAGTWPALALPLLAPGLALAGFGQGPVMTTIFRVALSEVPPDRAGAGGGALVASSPTSSPTTRRRSSRATSTRSSPTTTTTPCSSRPRVCCTHGKDGVRQGFEKLLSDLAAATLSLGVRAELLDWDTDETAQAAAWRLCLDAAAPAPSGVPQWREATVDAWRITRTGPGQTAWWTT